MSIGRVGPGPFDTIDTVTEQLGPLYSCKDINDPEQVLLWMRKAVDVTKKYYRVYFNIQQNNILIYKGIQWLNQDSVARLVNRNGVPTRRSPRVVINHICDLVEQWKSRLTRFPPSVAVFPANPDYDDKEDARVSDIVLQDIWYRESMDTLLQELVGHLKVMGEAHLFIEWNPNKGDVSPEIKQYEQQVDAYKSAIVGPDGEPVESSEGHPMQVTKLTRIGDVDYTLVPGYQVMDQPASSRKDIDWTIRWEVMDVDYLRLKYPEHKDKISSDKGFDVSDDDYDYELNKLKNQVVVYKLYHRHHEFLPKGRYIVCTRDVVLEMGDLPYTHGEIPRIYIADIDVPGEIRGMSFIQQLFPLQHQINACASLIYKSLVLFAHPKIVMPDGACDIQQLLNESTVVTYQGPVAPTLMNNVGTPQELFAYLDKLEQSLEKLSGVFTMSRGQAPSGVRAAKALRVLEEQEDKRAHLLVSRYNQQCVINNAKMTLSVAGTYYKDTDGRLARIVGKNNEHLVVKFKKANLSKQFDIRILGTTALSRSPAARIDEIIELQNVRFDPSAPFDRAQFYNLLDFGNADEMKDIATRAVMCAQSENEDILSGKQVLPPSEDEELITHWQVHLQPIQQRAFKINTPPERQQALKDHILATEMLMVDKAFGIIGEMGTLETVGNPAFAARLQTLENWPVYYKISPMRLMAAQQAMMPPAMPGGGAGGPPPNSQALGGTEEPQ